jgi:hypothetical protein
MKTSIQELDFASVAERTGAELIRDRLAIRCLGKVFELDRNGDLHAMCHINQWIQVPILSYVINCQGRKPAGEWVKFQQLKNTEDWVRFYEWRCDNELKRMAEEQQGTFLDLTWLFSSQSNQQKNKDQRSMSVLETLSKKEIKELLSKGWMTHDAMWFASCYQQLGIDKTNELNLSAVALMAGIEVGRIRKAIGMQEIEIDNFDSLRSFFERAMDLILPEFMQAEFGFPEDCVISWRWKEQQCFAYKGLKRIGAADRYRCGVMYRIKCWLSALNIRFRFDPPVDGCLMHQSGSCKGRILVEF